MILVYADETYINKDPCRSITIRMKNQNTESGIEPTTSGLLHWNAPSIFQYIFGLHFLRLSNMFNHQFYCILYTCGSPDMKISWSLWSGADEIGFEDRPT